MIKDILMLMVAFKSHYFLLLFPQTWKNRVSVKNNDKISVARKNFIVY